MACGTNAKMRDGCQRYDVTILGDFNAKVGSEGKIRGITGTYSLHLESNNNNDLLIQLVSRKKVIIKNTWYSHKIIHLGRWKVPGSSTINQIDLYID